MVTVLAVGAVVLPFVADTAVTERLPHQSSADQKGKLLGAGKLVGKMLERSELRRVTTTFSNLGLIRLRKEIEERVEMLEFVLGDQPSSRYSVSCIAVGDALALTTTVSVEDRGITETVIEGLEGSG